MRLHIFIGGEERFDALVEPGQVERTLRIVEAHMPALVQNSEGRRVTVALDSDTHRNVTYLLNWKAA